MKKILFVLFLFISFFGYTQDTIRVIITKDILIYDNDIMNKKIVATAKTGQTIDLLSYSYIGSSFYVFYDNINGYIMEWNLSEIPNIENIKNTLSGVKVNTVRSVPKSDLEKYKEMYGKPDDTSTYSSGNYRSITYTWYCARGKYRSIDFIWKNGKYVKESEYTSDCLRF